MFQLNVDAKDTYCLSVAASGEGGSSLLIVSRFERLADPLKGKLTMTFCAQK